MLAMEELSLCRVSFFWVGGVPPSAMVCSPLQIILIYKTILHLALLALLVTYVNSVTKIMCYIKIEVVIYNTCVSAAVERKFFLPGEIDDLKSPEAYY